MRSVILILFLVPLTALSDEKADIVRLGIETTVESPETFVRQLVLYSKNLIDRNGYGFAVKQLDELFTKVDPKPLTALVCVEAQKIAIWKIQMKRAGVVSREEYGGLIGGSYEKIRSIPLSSIPDRNLFLAARYFIDENQPAKAMPFLKEGSNRPSEVLGNQFNIELGQIEMMSAEKATVDGALKRFYKIVESAKSRSLISRARLNIGIIYLKRKDLESAMEEIDIVFSQKKYDKENRDKRAEAHFRLGFLYQERGEVDDAAKKYLTVLVNYLNFPEYAIDAFDQYLELSLNTVAAVPNHTKRDREEQRKRQKALYKLYFKQMFMWQNLTSEDSPSDALETLRARKDEIKSELEISPKDEKVIRLALGIHYDWEI